MKLSKKIVNDIMLVTSVKQTRTRNLAAAIRAPALAAEGG